MKYPKKLNRHGAFILQPGVFTELVKRLSAPQKEDKMSSKIVTNEKIAYLVDGLRKGMKNSFMISRSEDGKYRISISFPNIHDMQAAHSALTDLCGTPFTRPGAEVVTTIEQLIVDAFKSGVGWWRENQGFDDAAEYVGKAANDHADGAVGRLGATPLSAEAMREMAAEIADNVADTFMCGYTDHADGAYQSAKDIAVTIRALPVTHK